MNKRRKPSGRDQSSPSPVLLDLEAYLSGLAIRDHWTKRERESAKQIITNAQIKKTLTELIQNYGVEEVATWIGQAICLPMRFEQLVTQQRIQTLQAETTKALEDIALFRRGIHIKRGVIADAVSYARPSPFGSREPSTLQKLHAQLDELQSALKEFKSRLDRHPVPRYSRKSKVSSARLYFFVREMNQIIRKTAGRPHIPLIAMLARICLELSEVPPTDQLKQICRSRMKQAGTR